MKKTILAVMIITGIGFSGYHFINNDQENQEMVKEIVPENIEQGKVDLKENFDYSLNMEKTYENGYRDGRCKEFGSNCNLALMAIYNKESEDRKKRIEKANLERDKQRLIADAEIKEIQEANRLRLEYEANRNFTEEISEYTPIVDQVLTFENIKELDLESTQFEGYVDDYELSSFKSVGFFEGVNHKVFKVANSDSYIKFFEDIKDRELLSGITVPHIDDKDNYSMKTLNCKEEHDDRIRKETDFKCDTFNISINMRKFNKGSIRFTIRYNNMYPHKEYMQEIIINRNGEMLVIDPYRDDSGKLREFKRERHAID